jgi:hypothetical protein
VIIVVVAALAGGLIVQHTSDNTQHDLTNFSCTSSTGRTVCNIEASGEIGTSRMALPYPTCKRSRRCDFV